MQEKCSFEAHNYKFLRGGDAQTPQAHALAAKHVMMPEKVHF